MTVTTEIPGVVDEFVKSLEALARPDGRGRADMARLKRCAGRSLAECPEIFTLFYHLLPPPVRGRDFDEETYFLVATLFPCAPGRWTGDFGASMAKLKAEVGEHHEGIDRRMAVLLDCGRSDLPFRLRQFVRLLASKDVPVDWRALLHQIRRWDSPRRLTQKAWARSYFGGRSAATASTPEEET